MVVSRSYKRNKKTRKKKINTRNGNRSKYTKHKDIRGYTKPAKIVGGEGRIIRWSYRKKGESLWTPYTNENNIIIEQAYKENESVSVDVGDFKHDIKPDNSGESKYTVTVVNTSTKGSSQGGIVLKEVPNNGSVGSLSMQCLWISICDWLRITKFTKDGFDDSKFNTNETTEGQVNYIKEYSGCKPGGKNKFNCNNAKQMAEIQGDMGDGTQQTDKALRNLASQLGITIRIFNIHGKDMISLFGFDGVANMNEKRASPDGNSGYIEKLEFHGTSGFNTDPNSQILIVKSRLHFQLITEYYNPDRNFNYSINTDGNVLNDANSTYGDSRVYVGTNLITLKELVDGLYNETAKEFKSDYLDVFTKIIIDKLKETGVDSGLNVGLISAYVTNTIYSIKGKLPLNDSVYNKLSKIILEKIQKQKKQTQTQGELQYDEITMYHLRCKHRATQYTSGTNKTMKTLDKCNRFAETDRYIVTQDMIKECRSYFNYNNDGTVTFTEQLINELQKLDLNPKPMDQPYDILKSGGYGSISCCVNDNNGNEFIVKLPKGKKISSDEGITTYLIGIIEELWVYYLLVNYEDHYGDKYPPAVRPCYIHPKGYYKIMPKIEKHDTLLKINKSEYNKFKNQCLEFMKKTGIRLDYHKGNYYFNENNNRVEILDFGWKSHKNSYINQSFDDIVLPNETHEDILVKSDGKTINIGEISIKGKLLPTNEKISDELLTKFKQHQTQTQTQDTSTQSKFAIASYNIGWATQKNVAKGTEKYFIETKCHTKDPNQNKTSTDNKQISWCSTNAAEALLSVEPKLDLIGIQEAVNPFTGNLVKYMNTQTDDSRYKMVYGGGKKVGKVAIIYDKKLGNPNTILEGDLGDDSDSRPYQIVYFSKTKLLVINLHAPHGQNDSGYNKIFKKFNSEISSKIDKKDKKDIRIIITGDFNDNNQVYMKTPSITILGKKCYLGGYTNGKNIQHNTCCYGSKGEYRRPGDYIFDSETQTGKYDIIEWNYDNFPGSDHKPVFLVSNKGLENSSSSS